MSSAVLVIYSSKLKLWPSNASHAIGFWSFLSVSASSSIYFRLARAAALAGASRGAADSRKRIQI